MSEGLPGPGGGAEGGAGRAGVAGDRPHGAGLRRLDEGGAVRRARGSGPLAATDGLAGGCPRELLVQNAVRGLLGFSGAMSPGDAL